MAMIDKEIVLHELNESLSEYEQCMQELEDMPEDDWTLHDRYKREYFQGAIIALVEIIDDVEKL